MSRSSMNGALATAAFPLRYLLPQDAPGQIRIADGGYVTNKAGGFGSGSLYSVGSGLRFGKGKAELGIEAAYPLNADPMHGESKDPRINLSVSLGL